MNSIISDIRKKQDEIILMVNTAFDEIIKEVSNLNQDNFVDDNEYEAIYPLTNTSGFKGKKVIAVILNGERIIAPTWKSVVEIILKDAVKDERRKEKLCSLCNKFLGRKRTRLSSNSDGMRSPLEIDENLYVETHYDTETLINFLLQLLSAISYDYDSVKIAIRN